MTIALVAERELGALQTRMGIRPVAELTAEQVEFLYNQMDYLCEIYYDSEGNGDNYCECNTLRAFFSRCRK